MTSINQIPYRDIEIFLDKNGLKIPKNEDAARKLVLDLLKDKTRKKVGHTRSILEWLKAYNLIHSKVDIKLYTLDELDRMTQNQINNLAKKLTMESNNIESIKNILRYLNKFDETVHFGTNAQLSVAGKNVFDIMMTNMDNRSLNFMNINKYNQSYLEDQEFWKKRLKEKFGLVTDIEDFDYKFAVKFLDNGKSFEENYKEAMDKGYKSIIGLLLDNKVVKEIKPVDIMGDLSITTTELGENKNLPYNEFIKIIMDYNNEIYEDRSEDEELHIIDKSFFDKIEYTGKNFQFEFNQDDDDESNMFNFLNIDTYGGITNGEILYAIAQITPTEDEILQSEIERIREYPETELARIDYSIATRKLPKPGMRGFHYNMVNKRLSSEELKKKYPDEFLINLLKDPEEYIKFANENKDEIFPDYKYLDPFGNHVFWEGLTYDENTDSYTLHLGS